MARADLLLALVKSGAAGDDLAFRRAAEALIAEEEGKKHGVLASQLTEALTRRRPSGNVSMLGRNDEAAALLHEFDPERRASDLVLPAAVRQAVNELIEEHHRRDLLRSHGVEPRHRVMLIGPPGGGKTSLAEAIATELAVPILSVRYEGVIGSFLGETALRLDTLFAAVRLRPCVLFFDEFDSIAKERGDTHETGEIKRVVSFLLMQLDQLPSYVIVVAATNHGELLDRAVWRRFQMRLAIPAPKKNEISVFLDRIVSGWPNAPKMPLNRIASRLGAVSYAEALNFCQNVRRRQILGLGEVSIDDALRVELDLWTSRVTPESINAERPNEASPEADTKS